jgi:pimeloyl-ACP methyl ester carboxylesterase
VDAFSLTDVDAFLRYAHLPGRKPALVYLTGLGLAAWGTYDGCVADRVLAARQRVLVDVLGAGLSDAPEAFPYGLEDHAATIASLLDHLALKGATIVAYRFGGAVAITLAATRPELVRALVLAAPNLEPGGGFLSGRIARQSEEAFRKDGFAELLAESRAKGRAGSRPWAVTSGMMQIASPHGLHRTAVGLVKGIRPTMRERLLTLRIPRTIIRGADSGPNPREAELVAGGARLLTVPRAGHGMMWENPTGFVAAVSGGGYILGAEARYSRAPERARPTVTGPGPAGCDALNNMRRRYHDPGQAARSRRPERSRRREVA